MQNDQIYSDLLNLVLTKDDLNLINSQLDILEAGIYETKGNTFDSVLKNLIPENLAGLIYKLVASEDKEAVIKKIRESLSSILFVEVTVAIDPSQTLIEKIAIRLKELIGQKVALDIKVDRSIIGGAKIIYEGKYFDGSLKNKLDKILVNYV